MIETWYNRLAEACTRGGSIGAIRITADYQPIAGPGTKIFPPTYPNDVKYLQEDRYIGGAKVPTVIVDSVQSQANRLEEALLGEIDDRRLQLPILEIRERLKNIDFRVTSLDAPHRSPDAYFRDSETLDGVAFDQSAVGRELLNSTEAKARGLYMYSPADLVLGLWDSQRGGSRGLKLPRAYTSELIGTNPLPGSRAAGRLDPYNIQKVPVNYVKEKPDVWALDSKDIPKEFKSTVGSPSNVNHGNALASSSPGGFSVAVVRRVAVVSFAVLQRLRFPDAGGGGSTEVDVAGRSVLASLALLGDRLAFAGSSLFLRSGCDLSLESETISSIGRAGVTEDLSLDVVTAEKVFELAVQRAASLGLEFASEPVVLRPKKNLRDLLELSLSKVPEE